jgi:hypothetical protein
MDAKEINLDRGKRLLSNPESHWDTRYKGTEFPFIVMCCSEADVPCFFIVRSQESPALDAVKEKPFKEFCGIGETERGIFIFDVVS